MITQEKTTKIYDMISSMNFAFGNKKGLSLNESGKITEKGAERLKNQLKNLYDENRELRDDAFIPKIRKEIFDAIADISVFLYGANHFLNLPLHDFSVSFSDGIQLPDGKTFSVDNIEEARDYVSKNSFNMLNTIIDRIIKVAKNKDISEYQKNAIKLSEALHTIFELFKKDNRKHTMIYLNKLVNDSNLSKLCRNKEEVDATVKFYTDKNVKVSVKFSDLLQDNGENFMIVYSPIEQIIQDMKNGELLFNKETGEPIMKEYRKDKFLKNTSWFEPDLSKF